MREQVRWADVKPSERLAPPAPPTTTRQGRPAESRTAPPPAVPARPVDTAASAAAPREKTAAPAAPSLLTPDSRLMIGRPKRAIFEPDPVGSLETRVYSAEEKDSIARVRAQEFAAAAARRVPTQAEKDERWKEATRPGTIPGRTAGEQGSIANRGAGGGFSVPIFGAGPSPEKRRRDSVAAAEGLAVLKRLQERTRRREDSIRIADSSKRASRPR